MVLNILYVVVCWCQAADWGAPEAAGGGETAAGGGESTGRGEETDAGGAALSERDGGQTPEGAALEGAPGWPGETGQGDSFDFVHSKLFILIIGYLGIC